MLCEPFSSQAPIPGHDLFGHVHLHANQGGVHHHGDHHQAIKVGLVGDVLLPAIKVLPILRALSS